VDSGIATPSNGQDGKPVILALEDKGGATPAYNNIVPLEGVIPKRGAFQPREGSRESLIGSARTAREILHSA
jgi:hypothetical protein